MDVVFGILVVSFGSYGLLDAFFPRLHNDLSCGDSTPASSVQLAALKDARSRAAGVCAEPQTRCKFAIHDYFDADGLFRISPYIVETDFFEGCIYKDQTLDVFVYSRDGRFVRMEGAPFG